MQYPLPTFLPGELTLEPGSPRDYRELEQFHYLPKRPATWAAVWSIRYTPFSGGRHGRGYSLDPQHAANTDSRLIAVGVLSYPVPSHRARERFLNRTQFSRTENLTFANANIRTISRVVVHPQFRSLGLSSILVRCLCDNCPTRYIESSAAMARAHPFFEKAGMLRIDPLRDEEPIYFILDRDKSRNELPRSRYESDCGSNPPPSNLTPCNASHDRPRRCA